VLVAIGDRTGGSVTEETGPPDLSSKDCRVVTLWGSRVRAWILRRHMVGGSGDEQ
jgi:hypothetical protein